MNLVRILSIFFGILFISELGAQSSQELFGKNRIQYKAIKWKVIESDRFEVYYYGENYDLARIAATYGEADLNRITSLLSYSASDKIKIVLYNSVTDQLQSNIGLNNDELLVGGQTVLVKSKVEVAFRGVQYLFMEDISYGIAHILLDNMMYGGSLKDVVKSSYLMHLPDWFMEGAAAQVASGWSREMDNYVRDLAIHKKLRTPGSYRGKEARLIGQSVFNYIEQEYSANDLSVVIGYTKIFRDIEESVEAALGVSYPDFIRKWRHFYANEATMLEGIYSYPEDSVVVRKAFKSNDYTQLAMNSTGQKVAWVSNRKGRYKVRVMELESGKVQTVFRAGYRRLDQPVDSYVPVLGWQSEEAISLCFKKRLNVYLRTVDLKKGKRTTTLLNDLRQVFGFAYSPNGGSIVLSADKYGQSDLFLLSGGSLKQLTNDYYDDLYPGFSGTDIYFSSNRFSDTIGAYPGGLPSYSEQLHLYKMVPGSRVLSRTSLDGNTIFLSKTNNQLLVLNDASGIQQLYTVGNGALLKSKNSSDYKMASVPPGSTKYAYLSRRNGKDVLGIETFSPTLEYEITYTERQRYVNTALGKIDSKEENTTFSSEEEINLDNVIFESDVARDSTLLEEVIKKELPNYIIPILTSTGARYQNAMSGEKINSTLLVDPIRGLGMQMEAGMSDLLGNHRINAGAFLAFDFRSNKIFGEYSFLQRRMDFKIRYDRQGIFATNEYQVIQRYILNSFYGTMSYPFSPYHRVSLSPGITHTRFGEITDLASITQQDKRAFYTNLRGEYVFDNSLITGMNMVRGTKAKFTIELNSGQKSFQLYNLDIRKYIPVHKELTLALRAAHGGFLGDSPKNFLLGGMDNWIFGQRSFYSTINNGPYNPLVIEQGVDNSDLLFLRYALNMRGFGYQSQFGNKYVLFNAEIRLPVVQYFSNGTIGSAFLRNLQFVSFMDAGSSYDGKNPFTTDNSQSTKVVTGYPFNALVKNYRSPFLYGYGGGVRTLLFGYYVKFDVAMGVKDGIRQKPIAYLTFGYDF